jgi:hypothetical protein
LLGEGDVVGELNPVSSIDVRFDCPKVSPEQISFQWYYNGQEHCTHTYQSDDCDKSSLTDWDSLPGKFLITLINKDGLIGDLPSGKYKLVVYVDGKEATSGTVTVNP